MGTVFYERLAFSLNVKRFLVFMQINPPTPPPPFFRDCRAGGQAGGTHRRMYCLVKMFLIGPRGGLTLCVFLLTSCCVYPTWLGRAGTERKQQHDSVVQGPPCHHRAQGSSVNPFGYPPLSDDRPPCSGIGERGIYPQYIPNISPIYVPKRPENHPKRLLYEARIIPDQFRSK